MSDSPAGTAALTAACRVLLPARAALAASVGAAATGGLALPGRLLPAAAVVAFVSAGQALAVGRWPSVLRRPVRLSALLGADVATLVAVLALAGPGWFFLAFTTDFAMLGGVWLGFAAAPVWAGLLLQTYAVGAAAGEPAALLAVPAAGGIAGALLRSLVSGYARRAAAHLSAAQREAATLERARLARELHDSVAKTVHGMALAAMALPDSVSQHPHLAARLADAISTAAAAAERETRDLLAGMRLDRPDEDFRHTLGRLCDVWAGGSGIPVRYTIAAVEPPVPVRYEACRILQEALTNIGRHARASHVAVTALLDDRWLRLVVEDDGVGFVMPDLAVLSRHNHHGLVGMAERARSVGGRFDVAARPGQGTTITVRLPA